MSPGGHPRTLAHRYRLDEVIGRGGMSTVYRATDLSLDRVVAVKVAMDPLLERDPVYAARFKREARAAAALNNPGVVTVFDAGSDGPTRYIVMECVEGQDLAHVLRDDGPLQPARAARIAEQVADTLAAAHAAGIIHRDIKPGNIMVAEGGAAAAGTDASRGTPGAGVGPGRERVKVLDFGIAHTADAVTLTQTASVLGTAPYMSPEQAMGNPADARSDIYSLGCVLYEMLTGKPPFMAEVPAAVLHQHVRVAPKPPRESNPAIPPALNALVLQMLAKAPEDRPQTAAEVRDRLANFETETAPTKRLPPAEAVTVAAAAAAAAAEVPQMATVPQAVGAPPTVPPDPTEPTRALPPSRSRGAGPWAFLAVVALLLLGAAVAYALASGGKSSTSSSAGSHPSTPASGSSARTGSHTSSTSSNPSTSTSSSTPSTSTSTTTTTITTTSSSTPSTATGPSATPPPPPGQGGVPPGQAKKKDKKK